MMGMDEWRDEHDLDYCPRCGEALEGTRPVECPGHGPVAITYQEVPSDEEMMGALFGDGGGEDERPFAFLDDLANEMERAADELDDHDDADGRGENPRDDVRGRINRLLGRE
jgi:hypothetical protein